MLSLKFNENHYLYFASCYKKHAYEEAFRYAIKYLQREKGQSLNKTGGSAYTNISLAYLYYFWQRLQIGFHLLSYCNLIIHNLTVSRLHHPECINEITVICMPTFYSFGLHLRSYLQHPELLLGISSISMSGSCKEIIFPILTSTVVLFSSGSPLQLTCCCFGLLTLTWIPILLIQRPQWLKCGQNSFPNKSYNTTEFRIQQ